MDEESIDLTPGVVWTDAQLAVVRDLAARTHRAESALQAALHTPDTTTVCSCGGDVWSTCDHCGADAWCSHHCDFPCDDVTCENGTVCTGCLTGRLCPVHNNDEWEGER